MDVRVLDMNDFVDISEDTLRYYFGDIHLVDDVAYKVKVFKPLKVKGRFLAEQIKK